MGYLIPREEFLFLMISFSVCSSLYFLLVIESNNRSFGIGFGLFLAIIFRLIFIVAVPELSDDFYRYIFDGQLVRNSISPYLFLPKHVFEITGLESNNYWHTLLSQMNSPTYFSVYPPLHQLIFWISAMAGDQLLYNIITIRLILIVFDILNIFLIWKIIKNWGMPNKAIWLYAFNPLVILEISGNLHFEGMVLTGLLLSIYAFSKNKMITSAMAWSWAVGLKLTPLIIGPLWLITWKRNKLIAFVSVSGLAILIFMIPLTIGNGFLGFWESLRLYQRTFEFNASIYYLLRNCFSFFLGYNPIAYLGPVLNFAAFAGILTFAYFWKIEKAKDVANGMVWIYLIFLLLQPVVHPWYLIPAFGVSVLTKNKVFSLWTFLAFLSYAAYRHPEVKESWILLWIEYGVLFGYLFYKISRDYRSQNFGASSRL